MNSGEAECLQNGSDHVDNTDLTPTTVSMRPDYWSRRDTVVDLGRRDVFETCYVRVPSLRMHDMFDRPIGKDRVAYALSIVGFIGSEWQCSNKEDGAASGSTTIALLRSRSRESGKEESYTNETLACSRGQEIWRVRSVDQEFRRKWVSKLGLA